MFHFPRLPPPGLCVQPGVMAHNRHRVAPFGNPGISLLDGSSWLIAVIPRPSSARSAKASTVRRSHLTCATPRACTAERKPVPEVVAHLEAPVRAARRAVPAPDRVEGQAQSSLHVVRTTHVPPAPVRLRTQPVVARVSRSPPDVDGIRRHRRFPGGCCGRISITMSLVKAHPEVGRPASERGLLNKGCKKQSYPCAESAVNKLFTVSNRLGGRRWVYSLILQPPLGRHSRSGSARRGGIFGWPGVIARPGLKIVRWEVSICPDLSRSVWIRPDVCQFGQISSRQIHSIAESAAPGRTLCDRDGRDRDPERPSVLIVSAFRRQHRRRKRAAIAVTPGPRESGARAGVGRVRSRA